MMQNPDTTQEIKKSAGYNPSQFREEIVNLSKRQIDLVEQSCQKKKKKQEEDEDIYGDKWFCRNIYNHLLNVPPSKKLLCQKEIYDVIQKYAYDISTWRDENYSCVREKTVDTGFKKSRYFFITIAKNQHENDNWIE